MNNHISLQIIIHKKEHIICQLKIRSRLGQAQNMAELNQFMNTTHPPSSWELDLQWESI